MLDRMQRRQRCIAYTYDTFGRYSCEIDTYTGGTSGLSRCLKGEQHIWRHLIFHLPLYVGLQAHYRPVDCRARLMAC